MVERSYLQDVQRQLRKYKELADKAVGQTDDDHFFATLDEECNSIALVMKHVAGNMRSRWTDFLIADGEKPDRHRDSEFAIEDGDTREHLIARWNDAWELTLSTIGELDEADLARVVTVRGEPHSVLEAINRQLTHYSYHIGQIVLLAKHYAGDGWQSLSIPRGRSADVDVFNRATMRPEADSAHSAGL